MSDRRLITELFTEQSPDPPKTAANGTLKEAARAYHNGEMTKSANGFLRAWRILRIEQQNLAAGKFELVPPWNADVSKLDFEVIARENQARVIMSICSLADLALACLGCTGKYQSTDFYGYPSYALDRFPLENNGVLATVEVLELEGKIWPIGSRVCEMFRLIDDMGFTIKNAESFAKVARKFCDQARCTLWLWPRGEHSELKEEVEKTLKKISSLAN